MLARGADHGLLKIHEQNLTVNVAVAGDGIKNAECFTIHLDVSSVFELRKIRFELRGAHSVAVKKNAGHARYGTAA